MRFRGGMEDVELPMVSSLYLTKGETSARVERNSLVSSEMRASSPSAR